MSDSPLECRRIFRPSDKKMDMDPQDTLKQESSCRLQNWVVTAYKPFSNINFLWLKDPEKDFRCTFWETLCNLDPARPQLRYINFPGKIGFNKIMEGHEESFLCELRSSIVKFLERYKRDPPTDNLGEKLKQTRMSESIPDYGPQVTLLVGVSGTGKTRHLESLLSKNWGFYFMAGNLDDSRPNSDIYAPRRGYSSHDIHWLWKSIEGRQTPKDYVCTSNHIFPLLYSRLLILDIFRQEAKCQQKDDPIYWLLFQQEQDPFSKLSWLFLVRSVDIDEATTFCRKIVEKYKFDGKQSILYICIDEAQCDLEEKVYQNHKENEAEPFIMSVTKSFLAFSDMINLPCRTIISRTSLELENMKNALKEAMSSARAINYAAKTDISDRILNYARSQWVEMVLLDNKGFEEFDKITLEAGRMGGSSDKQVKSLLSQYPQGLAFFDKQVENILSQYPEFLALAEKKQWNQRSQYPKVSGEEIANLLLEKLINHRRVDIKSDLDLMDSRKKLEDLLSQHNVFEKFEKFEKFGETTENRRLRGLIFTLGRPLRGRCLWSVFYAEELNKKLDKELKKDPSLIGMSQDVEIFLDSIIRDAARLATNKASYWLTQRLNKFKNDGHSHILENIRRMAFDGHVFDRKTVFEDEKDHSLVSNGFAQVEMTGNGLQKLQGSFKEHLVSEASMEWILENDRERKYMTYLLYSNSIHHTNFGFMAEYYLAFPKMDAKAREEKPIGSDFESRRSGLYLILAKASPISYHTSSSITVDRSKCIQEEDIINTPLVDVKHIASVPKDDFTTADWLTKVRQWLGSRQL
ncbi:hypothetical protein EV356DRAFT_556001 [Viridothelium virens]|uniref:Uncharacterized protein n=1 Tax=Viridothelium virens TaxID=1048519 RepID=A0A6A6GUV9_VIRVR|nr:hypothetical protein EV356DRAFT_556001 [Viridothelium virens]